MGSKANESLRRSVWAQSVKRIPKTSTRRGKSSQVYETNNPDGGKVDLYRYGGKKTKHQQYRDLITGSGSLYGHSKKSQKEQKKIEEERKKWQGIAKEIGVNLNSESDVVQMIDHVMSGSYAKEKSKDNNKPSQDKPEYEYKPVGDPPSQGDKDGGAASPEPLEAAPRLSGFTDNPSKDAIRGGDDLNDWYQKKFVPHLQAEADFGTASIDNDMGFYLEKFAHEPPELGDATDLFDKYKKKIDKAAK